MAKLSKAAIALLQAAGCSEVADDYVLVGNTDIRILLSARAVQDLNAQARGDEVEPVPRIPIVKPTVSTPDPELPEEPPALDPYLEGITNRR